MNNLNDFLEALVIEYLESFGIDKKEEEEKKDESKKKTKRKKRVS
jgi:hypothetical protein